MSTKPKVSQKNAPKRSPASDYQLIDSGTFLKLEQVGPFRIVRPAASAVWSPSKSQNEWKDVDARFYRYENGNGEWKVFNSEIKKPWTIKIDEITFNVKLTGFGHLGLFAEQMRNWRHLRDLIAKRVAAGGERPRILNLFAYTGGSTLFAASAGAEVVHLDASKSSVAWARENAASSGLADRPIRWIVDDVKEFVTKELRRGKQYEGIILDPPTYGRGTKNEVWKIETDLVPLLEDLKKLFSNNPLFMLLSSHSPGYTPVSLENQLRQICKGFGGEYKSAEMVIQDSTDKALPSGADCLWQKD
jgi:23S rRNA (cytosine1962-C5)-methyltransferase